MNIRIKNCKECPCMNIEESDCICNILKEYIDNEDIMKENCPLNNAQDNQIVITKE